MCEKDPSEKTVHRCIIIAHSAERKPAKGHPISNEHVPFRFGPQCLLERNGKRPSEANGVGPACMSARKKELPVLGHMLPRACLRRCVTGSGS